jgi:hypothetical protein
MAFARRKQPGITGSYMQERCHIILQHVQKGINGYIWQTQLGSSRHPRLRLNHFVVDVAIINIYLHYNQHVQRIAVVTKCARNESIVVRVNN